MKMDLQEEGCGGMDCIDLAQDRKGVNASIKFVPFLEKLRTG